MRKWYGVLSLCLLLAVVTPGSIAMGEWFANCLPLLIWILVLAIGRHRWPVLGDFSAVTMGMLYGALVGVAFAAFFNCVMISGATNQYYRFPYSSAAFSIILLLAILLLIGVAVFDFIKFRWKPLWVRLVTALVCYWPCMLTSWDIMVFFEDIFSQYV